MRGAVERMGRAVRPVIAERLKALRNVVEGGNGLIDTDRSID